MTHKKLTNWWLENNEDLRKEKPFPHDKSNWPPNYAPVYNWRAEVLRELIANPLMLKQAKNYYSIRPVEFIMDWIDTYDPRVKPPRTKWMPFVFFKRQVDVINFIEDCLTDQESGLVEKCRDFGLSWLGCAYSIYCFLFKEDFAIGWGSRKELLVDKPGDPDSLFEKMRLILKHLPKVWLPDGFNWNKHSTFMKLVNPENGSIISGEAGDNIGRGGRRSLYFLDEAAHLERAEKVEAALGDNTNVRIDISSVNGVGNVFYRRRKNGLLWTPGSHLDKGYTRVFVADWREHPGKSQEWYNLRKAKYEREGMSHIFAQEVDRNYAASVSNVVIPYDWIEASVDAHIKVPYFAEELKKHKNQWYAGLDVADEGGDRNALTFREWVVWRDVQEWGSRDPGLSARKAVSECREKKGFISCQYDSIGVGSGVKTEYNRLMEDGIIGRNDIPFIPWNAGSSVIKPYDHVIPGDEESMKNKDYYGNLKAQAWWSLRTRFYKTFKAVTNNEVYNCDELISLDSKMILLEQLKEELKQPTTKKSSSLKLLIEKKPEGMKSPNMADSGVMCFFPLDSNVAQDPFGSFSM